MPHAYHFTDLRLYYFIWGGFEYFIFRKKQRAPSHTSHVNLALLKGLISPDGLADSGYSARAEHYSMMARLLTSIASSAEDDPLPVE
jgi:hypothetical protein